MCITAPGQVLSIAGGVALVESDGRRRRASLLLEPDVQPGDWVIAGSGTVLRRLEPAEARELLAAITAARSVGKPADPQGDLR